MTKDLNKIIKRLLNISKDVVSTFGMLSVLSSNDQETTEDFDYCIKELKSYLNTESIILNNLTLAELYGIYKILPDYDDNTHIFERTSSLVDDKIEELENSSESHEEIEVIKNDDENDSFETTENEDFDIEEYFLEVEASIKDETIFVNYINVITLKSIAERIKSIPTDNKNDYRYKQNLLNNLKTFKYLIFAQNTKMEKIGLNCRFNIENIPYTDYPDIDINTIAYNHCVSILDKLYHPPKSDNNLDDTCIELFNMLSFEIYLNYLDKDSLEKLLALCETLKSMSPDTFIGDIAKSKLLIKNKN